MWECYELNLCGSLNYWYLYYKNNIDKKEYQTFSIWWTDMRKCGLIVYYPFKDISFLN